MPLPMVHFGVAKELATMLGSEIHDLPQYYMGSIAPDAINMRDNRTDRDRNISHLCRENYPPHELWCQDICMYFEDLQNAPSTDFCIGYRVHLLTDSFWFATQYKAFEANYYNDPAPIQSKQAAYYNDTRQLDIGLYDLLPYREEIWGHLKTARGETLTGLVSASEVKAERDATFCWYHDPEDTYSIPVKYITIEDELDFIHKASQFIYQLCFMGGSL